jgi:hypothetical protein
MSTNRWMVLKGLEARSSLLDCVPYQSDQVSENITTFRPPFKNTKVPALERSYTIVSGLSLCSGLSQMTNTSPRTKNHVDPRASQRARHLRTSGRRYTTDGGQPRRAQPEHIHDASQPCGSFLVEQHHYPRRTLCRQRDVGDARRKRPVGCGHRCCCAWWKPERSGSVTTWKKFTLLGSLANRSCLYEERFESD